MSKFSNALKELRLQRDMTQEALAEKLGVSQSAIAMYETDKREPDFETLEVIADLFNVSMDSLLGNERAENQYNRLLQKLPLFKVPVSAGGGQWLSDGHEYEYQEFDEPPSGADFALRVRGDSMMPMYSDGDIVFVRANIIVEPGQVGVFYLNGEGYMKMWQGNRLVSLNPEYKPITIDEYDAFFICGRVIGKQ
ncbi:MAG: XRE family transcriptional regulator [Oscillospiraceae bacterium]|jgi:transcriptional regulator with XRE-family HTH domain|nr:XRE family transcriptional regulator [Oscillospiraceae bacterium]